MCLQGGVVTNGKHPDRAAADRRRQPISHLFFVKPLCPLWLRSLSRSRSALDLRREGRLWRLAQDLDIIQVYPLIFASDLAPGREQNAFDPPVLVEDHG